MDADSAAIPGLKDVEFLETASGTHAMPEQGDQAEHDVHVSHEPSLCRSES